MSFLACKINFSKKPTDLALNLQKTLISRDFNYPSVVIWSLGNEPNSYLPEAVTFFRKLAQQGKTLDKTRPFTYVSNGAPEKDLVYSEVAEIDIIMSNSYSGWYHLPNFSDNVLTDSIKKHAIDWMKKYPEKPFVHSEWGAGAVPGFHSMPSMTHC